MSVPRLEIATQFSGLPQPVDISRLKDALAVLEYTITGEPTDRGFNFQTENCSFSVHLKPGVELVSLRSQWLTELSYRSSWHHLFTVADAWNRSTCFATAFVTELSDGTACVHADFVTSAELGLTDPQLTERLLVGANACDEALDYVKWAHGVLLNPHE